jgi:cell division protein FtsB
MSEILEEYKAGTETFYRGRIVGKLLFAIVAVILFGIYIGDLFFGRSSLDVLLGLESEKEQLERRVEELKHENATLQKEYFELRQLDPDIP